MYGRRVDATSQTLSVLQRERDRTVRSEIVHPTNIVNFSSRNCHASYLARQNTLHKITTEMPNHLVSCVVLINKPSHRCGSEPN